jgi:seryl-tRNA synthetase
MRDLKVTLPAPAGDMAQEEIRKQVFFLSPSVRSVAFAEDGALIVCELSTEPERDLGAEILELASRVQRGLRSLQRRILYASQAVAAPAFSTGGSLPGIRYLGQGQVALYGPALGLFRYFDRRFREFGEFWNAQDILTPTLIPSEVLGRCDYFRSFPHSVTFACHLEGEAQVIDGFRSRHAAINTLDSKTMGDMATPEACLSPAVCYHVYHMYEGQTLTDALRVHAICGKCFRYESGNISDLRRLWDFTMREVVFLGSRTRVLGQRDIAIERFSSFLDEHRLAGEIRTASDPFFMAPDAMAKTYFQLSSETKYEISLLLPGGERLATGSFNYHTDFFGRAFDVSVEGEGPVHSVCVAFGLERWVHGLMAQLGPRIDDWPDCVRRAPELKGVEW